jgi:hypothetical protein
LRLDPVSRASCEARLAADPAVCFEQINGALMCFRFKLGIQRLELASDLFQEVGGLTSIDVPSRLGR